MPVVVITNVTQANDTLSITGTVDGNGATAYASAPFVASLPDLLTQQTYLAERLVDAGPAPAVWDLTQLYGVTITL